MAIDSWLMEKINKTLAERRVHYRDLDDDEIVKWGDLCVKEGSDDRIIMAEGLADSGRTAKTVRRDEGFDQILRAEADDDIIEELRDELAWAWKHLPNVSENMAALAAHKQNADLLIGEEEFDDDDDESDSDDPSDDE